MNLFSSRLPLWQGISEQPEPIMSLDFELVIDEYGLIRQQQSKSVSEKIAGAYANDGYRYITLPAGYSSWANQQLAPKLDFICKSLPELKHSKVLDIGGGSTYLGELLINEYGASEYTVIDPSVRDSSSAVKVIRDYFSFDVVSDISVDYVLSLSCLEHVPDPVGFLRDVNRLLLEKQGEAVIMFPDVTRQLSSGDINVLLHEHLTYFTEKSALSLLEQLGFDVLAYETKNDLFKVHLKAVKQPRTMIKVEPQRTLVAEFVNKLESALAALKITILNATESKKIIAFHGACNGLNNIFSLLSIEDFSSIFVLDSDSKKENGYLSAFPKPIQLATKDSYSKADVVYISAMTFYEDIRSNLVNNLGVPSNKILPLM